MPGDCVQQAAGHPFFVIIIAAGYCKVQQADALKMAACLQSGFSSTCDLHFLTWRAIIYSALFYCAVKGVMARWITLPVVRSKTRIMMGLAQG